MTPNHEQFPPSDAVARGYEGDDLNNKGLLVFLFFFFLTAVVLHAGLWVLLKNYLSTPRAEDNLPSAVTLIERFPSPQLQPSVGHHSTPREDLAALRRDEGRIFQQLGWETDAESFYPVIPERIVAQLQQREATTRPVTTTHAAKEGEK
jgi:hypothetical protein